MTTVEASNYLKQNELDIQAAAGSFFLVDFVFQTYLKAQYILGVNFSPVFVHFKKNFFTQVTPQSIINDIGYNLLNQYKNNNGIIDQLIREHESAEKGMDLLNKKCEAAIAHNEVSIEDLMKLCEEYRDVHTQWWKYASIGEEKGNIINNKIVPYFQNRFALDKGMSGELISTLAHPENLSLFNQERKAFFEMCLKTLQNKEIDITHYLENFFWKESNFYKQKVLTKEILYLQIKNTIDTLGHDGITHELEIIKNSQETRVQDEARYRTTYQFSKEDEQMMYFAKRIIEWIDIRKRGMMKSVYYMASFIQIIAARIGLNYEEASLLTVDELYAILGGTQVPGSTTFNERQGGCMVFFDNYEKKYIYGREGEELYRIAMNKNSDTILKGMVASRGNSQTVEAEVSVVMDTAESAFITGTILVTTMTRIEFVPLMKKARAIITDEGGLACHAAIVSRELGIPCIIGTKQATHKLKNGDKVSMNMQTGQITLLG